MQVFTSLLSANQQCQNTDDNHGINQPRAGLTVDSSQLTFVPSSKSRDKY